MNVKLKVKTMAAMLSALTLSAVAAGAADIGYVLAGPDVYYRAGQSVFERLAEADGHKILLANSEYSPSKELANVEDFIARGVDAIVLVSANAEAGTQAASRARDAGIPIFFVAALPTPEGYDVPTGIVSGNWIDMGYSAGKHIGENHGGKSIALVEGVYGQGITELIRKGFERGLAETGGNNDIVMAAAGNWSRQDALDVMQDFIASQKQIDIVYALNEEMMAGVIQALEESGQLDGKVLVSNNGKEIGWQWIKDGIMEASVANPPTMEAHLAYQMLSAHLDGAGYPRHVYNHQPLLTAGNLDGAVPWDVDDYIERIKSGALVVDLHAEPEVTKAAAFE